jgi:hypothetical protein
LADLELAGRMVGGLTGREEHRVLPEVGVERRLRVPGLRPGYRLLQADGAEVTFTVSTRNALGVG